MPNPDELLTEDEYRQRVGMASPEEEQQPKAALPRWPLILFGLVALVIAVESGATLLQKSNAPTPQDWQDIAKRLKQERKPGVPVLVAPFWIDPLVRLHLGDQIEMELMLLSDIDRHAEVFQISVRGAQHPWLEGRSAEASWEVGGITLARYRNQKPVSVTYDFTRSIRQARVTRSGSRQEQCNWDARLKRFRCDRRHGWNWAGPHLAEVEHRPYRCIFVHPMERHVMQIQFPATKLGRTIVGYTGIDDFENRKRSQEPVKLRVRAGSKVLATIEHQNEWNWRRFEINTAALEGQTHPVTFEVSAKKAYARTFCFAAEARR